MNRRILTEVGVYILVMILGGWYGGIRAEAGTIYNSPYVTFSPDRKAWTTDAGNQAVEWYAEDGSDDVITGVASALRPLDAGEHYYSIRRSGSVPIGLWKVRLSKVNCCHNGYPDTNDYHGIPFVRQACLKPHFSAWQPFCADCGQPIAYNHFYMSRAAVKSIDHMELRDDLEYYYLCPFNQNLEQGVLNRWHTCKAISVNKYRVDYLPNTGGESYGGYMAPSFHFYNNAQLYEGREVTPQTHLSLNSYSRIGWIFRGWNTKPDGSGTFYEDGAGIFNLCDGDCGRDGEAGVVRLYAMWEQASGKLSIILNEGTYRGYKGTYTIDGKYGEVFEILTDRLLGIECRAYFDENGGTKLGTIMKRRRFAGFTQREPFQGRLDGNTYHFIGPDGTWDYLEALFKPDEIVLPAIEKENYSFGGWYYDKALTKYAGDIGDRVVLSGDIIFYARWVELVLESEDNYESYDGHGAVNLSWSQPDDRDKIYKLYQSTDGAKWSQILEKDVVSADAYYEKSIKYNGFLQVYTIPCSGLYTVEAYGAQGANYGSFRGGYGGMAEGTFLFERGDMLYCTPGGQDGHNAGGKGMLYANGGGYSLVHSVRQGLLLIAGGGGGAGLNGNGGPGGSMQSLIDGRAGGNGVSGGGGGSRGGSAGELVVHHHTEGVCNHIHTGSPEMQGGCYTVEVKCNEKLQHIKTGTKHWYWAGSDTTYCPACGADATKGETCSGHDTNYYKHVCPVHGIQKNNTSATSPSVCTVIAEYALSCGMTQDYICGYEEGQVLSMKPAYGGSNYINEDAAYYYDSDSGAKYGNGEIYIWSRNIGYFEENSLRDVKAFDLAAPEKVKRESIEYSMDDRAVLTVKWAASKDFGTTYYHQVKSYSGLGGNEMCVSNVTKNTLTSGMKGYYYRVDENPDTAYDSSQFALGTGTELKIQLTKQNQYLHIAAVDVAGNLSELTHIPLGGKGMVPSELFWPLYTDPLVMQESDAVYLQGESGTYYVRCDGKTEFALNYSAHMAGPASEAYQMNYGIIESVEAKNKVARNIVFMSSESNYLSNTWLNSDKLRFSVGGMPQILEGSTLTGIRSGNGRDLSMTRSFLLSENAEGKQIALIPVVGADHGDSIIYSDHSTDEQNGIVVIGDKTAPVIGGMNVLDQISVLDRRDGQVTLYVTASDALSGIREFYLEIKNLDNDAVEKRYPGADGVIRVNITEDQPVFSGDFVVTAYACDNVGNETVLEGKVTEFDLQAQAQRLQEPYEPRFKRGETGCLKITTWGYAERVEIEFPEELTRLDEELNHTYVYELKQAYRQEESYEFMIPFRAPEGEEFRITVRAYKGDQMLERHPAIAVLDIEGSILDELHTILR